MGSFSYRKPPSVDELTAPITDVAVSDDRCPGCGGSLEHEGVGLAYVTDIPEMPRPEVRGYRVQICRCRGCGRRVRGRHPDVGPDQYGASAHRVGRRVMAAAHMLHYGVGIPVRRVPAVLRTLTGVELSQSAITQDALRRARGAVGDAYRRLRGSVRESAVVHTDDTGWRVGGESAFLMAFETDDATVYQVRGGPRAQDATAAPVQQSTRRSWPGTCGDSENTRTLPQPPLLRLCRAGQDGGGPGRKPSSDERNSFQWWRYA